MSIKSYINTEFISDENEKIFESLGLTSASEKEIASKMLKENIECTNTNESAVSKMLLYMSGNEYNKSLDVASDECTKMFALVEHNNDFIKPVRFVICESSDVFKKIENKLLNEKLDLFPLSYVSEYNRIIETVNNIGNGKRCDITLTSEYGKNDLVSLLCNEGKKVSESGDKLKFYSKSKNGLYVIECIATVDNANLKDMSLDESSIITDEEVLFHNKLLGGNVVVTKDIENGVAKIFSNVVKENKFIPSFDDESNKFGLWAECSNGAYVPNRFIKVDNANSYNIIKNQIKETFGVNIFEIKNIIEHNIVQSAIKSVVEGDACNIELTKRESVMELAESLCRKGFKVKHCGNNLYFYERVNECGDIIPMCSTVLKLENPEQDVSIQSVDDECSKCAVDEISKVDKVLKDKENELSIKDWELSIEKEKLDNSYTAKSIIDNCGGAEKFFCDMKEMYELYTAINNGETKEFNYDFSEFDNKTKTAFKLIKALFYSKKKCTQIKFENITINIK